MARVLQLVLFCQVTYFIFVKLGTLSSSTNDKPVRSMSTQWCVQARGRPLQQTTAEPRFCHLGHLALAGQENHCSGAQMTHNMFQFFQIINGFSQLCVAGCEHTVEAMKLNA